MPLASIPSPARSAWQFGVLPIRAQALAIVAGILVAIIIADRRYRNAGGPRGVMADVAAWAVPAGLLPAAVGALTARADHGGWHTVHAWDAILGLPGAVALGVGAAWLACRGLRPPHPALGRRVKLGPVLAAAAPAIAFGYAIAQVGAWFAQQGYGRPSSLPWAVAIAPAHRLSGYENFATFTPVFLYQALWDIAAGIAVAWIAMRFALPGGRVFALGAAAYAAGGFGLFWLGIGHLPLILGLRAGELGDTIVFIAAVAYLVRTRRARTTTVQLAHRPALERD
jgi:prolipoprotein diacylglyceryltransferase